MGTAPPRGHSHDCDFLESRTGARVTGRAWPFARVESWEKNKKFALNKYKWICLMFFGSFRITRRGGSNNVVYFILMTSGFK